MQSDIAAPQPLLTLPSPRQPQLAAAAAAGATAAAAAGVHSPSPRISNPTPADPRSPPCPVCSMVFPAELGEAARSRHVEACLDERSGNGDLFFCVICQEDLSALNDHQRQLHINRCCDNSADVGRRAEDNHQAGASSDSASAGTAPGDGQLPDQCPLCQHSLDKFAKPAARCVLGRVEFEFATPNCYACSNLMIISVLGGQCPLQGFSHQAVCTGTEHRHRRLAEADEGRREPHCPVLPARAMGRPGRLCCCRAEPPKSSAAQAAAAAPRRQLGRWLFRRHCSMLIGGLLV